MAIGGRLGVRVDQLPHPDLATALFAESIGRLLLEVRPDDLRELERFLGDGDRSVLGTVTAEPVLNLGHGITIEVDELVAAFTGRPAAAVVEP